MSDVIISIILKAIEEAIANAVKEGIKWIIRKAVDAAGNVVTEIVYKFDNDGDGEYDSEEVIYTIDTIIPDLSDGYCLCNKGDEIGLGLPSFRLVDADDVLPILRDLDDYLSDGDGFCIDLDDDGANDDILFPLPFDGTGDGLPDFQIIVDDDDNGLPDVSPDSPFYPIGSKGYQQITETHSDNVPALTKSFKNYTVSEALLFIIACGSLVAIFSKIFKRRKLL